MHNKNLNLKVILRTFIFLTNSALATIVLE